MTRISLFPGVSIGPLPALGAVAALADIDATSGIYVPSTAGQWTALGLTAPDSLFLCQEASGNLADSIGSITLTANASPTYQQSVSGWTRKAVGFADATANQRFRSTEAGLPDLATTSMTVLAYIAVTNNPGAARGIMGAGTPSGLEARAVGGTSTHRARAVAGTTVTSTTDAGTSVRPRVITVQGATTVKYYSNLEILSPTAGVPAGKLLEIGGTAGASPPDARCLYVAMWAGAGAEMSDSTVRTMLQTLGWTVDW